MSLSVSAGPPVATRAAQIEALRAAKAARLKPEEVSAPHRAFRYMQERRLYNRITASTIGLNARFGGLGPGAGFAAGPEYVRPGLFGGMGVLRTSVVGSTRQFYSGEVGITLPNLAAGRFSLDFSALRFSMPSIDYYGPGPGSFKSGRTDYNFENTGFETRAAFQLVPHVGIGGLTRYLLFNTGPGHASAYASTDRVYTPATTPGLLQQTNFINPGVFQDLDWRRFPLGRRDGSRFLVEYSTFLDHGPGSYSFGRVDLDFRHYIAFLNGQREIVFRARAVLTDSFGADGVPFYLQPQLGGSYDLRGFRARRFYDNNSTIVNAEYRWEIANDLDAALFADAGKVFHTVRQWLPLRHLESSYGFGFRVRRNSDVFCRFDFGYSREGPQIWLSFGDLF
jgi:outer membrane protein assembly factor BamA